MAPKACEEAVFNALAELQKNTGCPTREQTEFTKDDLTVLHLLQLNLPDKARSPKSQQVFFSQSHRGKNFVKSPVEAGGFFIIKKNIANVVRMEN